MHSVPLIVPQQVLIECKITPVGGVTNAVNAFDEQNFLLNRPIIGLEVFSASDMAWSPLQTNLEVIPDALLPFAFLNIQRSGINETIGTGSSVAGTWFKYMPLCSLRHVINFNNTVNVSGNLDKFRCDPMIIQWRDSNIAFPHSTAQTKEYSVPILVTYLLTSQDPTPFRMTWLKGSHH